MEFNFIKTNRLSVFEMMVNLDWPAIKALLDKWPDGGAGTLSIKKKRVPKSTEQLGYYYGKILPMAVEAFREAADFSLTIELGDKKIEVELTLNNMDNFLKLRYAAMTGEYVDKTDMSMAECSAFESWCIDWLAKWLKCQVPPADTEWNNKPGG